MNTPNRLLQELGEHAARYNRRTTDHAANCCPVCRRLLTDIITAMLDPSNWIPEPVGKQIDKLREELEALKERNGATYSGAERVSPVPPIEPETENPAGDFFTPPPPRGDDE